MRGKTRLKRLIPERYQRIITGLSNRFRCLLLSMPSTGARVSCPLCGRDYRRLLPYGLGATVVRDGQVVGGGRRPNAQCPGCFSLERERFLFLYLRDVYHLFDEHKDPGWRVLHLAPESNLQRVLRSQAHLDYVSADLSSPKAMVKTDITETGFPDGTFHVIICAHVLEHIPDDAKAMTELYRILKAGGRVVLQTPVVLSLEKTYEDAEITTPEEREKAYGQFDHVRIYGRDFRDRLTKAGFQVETFRFDENTIKKYGLYPDEDIYICAKP